MFEESTGSNKFASVLRIKGEICQSCIKVITIFVILFSPWAKAVDPYEFQIYGYATQGKGNFSPQLLSSFIPYGYKAGEGGTSETFASQSMLRSAIEFEYGITNKIDVAYYVNFARPTNEAVQYAGSKLRFRGRLSEKGELPIDLGWYVEIEQWQQSINPDTLELEFKPTLQKDFGPVSVIANLPFEKVLRGESAKMQLFEIGYLAEISYQKSDRLRFGIQFIGGPGGIKNMDPLREQQHYVMPVVHFAVSNKIRSTVGVGFGQTHGSDHILLKTNLTFGRSGIYWD